MESKKRITLKELTQITGFSRTTIYNVMNGKGNFSEDTRRRIHQAMRDYDYRPNLNARNLAKSRLMEIGVLAQRQKQFPFLQRTTTQGVHRALSEFEDDGLQIHLHFFEADSPEWEEEWIQHVDEMLEQGVRHFVLMVRDTVRIREQLERLFQNGCEVVFLNSVLEMEKMLCNVSCDYYRSGLLAAELVEKMMPAGGNLQVVLRDRFQESDHYMQRLYGLYDRLKPQSKYQLLDPLYLMEGKEDQQLQELLAREDLDGFVDMVHATSAILRQTEHFSSRMHLFSFDYYSELMPAMETGRIDAIVQQPLMENARLAIQVLFEYLCYGKQPAHRHISSPLNVVLGGNCHYYDC